MKRGTKAKPEEIITTLRKIEILLSRGKSTKEACRECEIGEDTFYKWRKMYSGMEISHLKELKQLKEENARLKRAVADLTLDKLILKEAAEGNF